MTLHERRTDTFTKIRGHSSMAEPLASNQKTSGSIPPARSNADIRPFISIGEAAELALSAIAAKMEKPE